MAAEPTPRTTAYKRWFQVGAAGSKVCIEKVDERKMRVCIRNYFSSFRTKEFYSIIWSTLLIIHLWYNCYSGETGELPGIVGYCLLHSASISTLINLRPHRSAKARQSSRLAIVPEASSLTNSHKTPPGGWPVRKHKSTALSVCPLRERTPPSLARRGTICPGRVKSDDCAEGEARARTVRLRSCAEIPVVVPWIKNKNKIR